MRGWAEATTGKLVLFERMEHLAGKLTHGRQGERIDAWRDQPYQHGYIVDDLAWHCTASGIEAGPPRLETMRRLALHLATQELLGLAASEQERNI